MTGFMWVVAGILAAFVGVGLIVAAREALSLRRARRQGATAETATARYVGPIDLHDAPLTPLLRVAAEFLSALCGFPGLGWMVSGRVAAGLPMFVIVPALIWALFPLYISMTGSVLATPILAFAPLPVIALVSAGALAVLEYRGTRAA